MSNLPAKPKRQQRKKDDFGSPTKQKGSPVVGRQASTLFGQPGAPKPGVTSEQRIATIKAAEIAAKLQLDFLTAYADKVTKLRQLDDSADHIIELVNSNSLKMLGDALDRAYGKAGQTLDVTSSDGTMSPHQAQQDAVLEALKRKHDPNS